MFTKKTGCDLCNKEYNKCSNAFRLPIKHNDKLYYVIFPFASKIALKDMNIDNFDIDKINNMCAILDIKHIISNEYPFSIAYRICENCYENLLKKSKKDP